MMLEEYETAYGIHNHDVGSDDPLAPILLREYENVSIGSDRSTMAYRYAKSKVFEVFHIPWDVFLKLPRADADELLEISFKVAVENEKARKEIADGFENMVSGK